MGLFSNECTSNPTYWSDAVTVKSLFNLLRWKITSYNRKNTQDDEKTKNREISRLGFTQNMELTSLDDLLPDTFLLLS